MIINRVWVDENFREQTVRALLNSDSDITDKYQYADYDNIVAEVMERIQYTPLYKVEYKGNLIGFFNNDWAKYFFKPEVRTEEFKELFERAISNKNKNTGQVDTNSINTVTLSNYQNIV